MRSCNLQKGEKGFRFEDVLWLLKDRVFFLKVVAVLRDRLIYNKRVWAYGFYHKGEEQIVREWFGRDKTRIKNVLGDKPFKSKLVEIGFEDTEFKHLDYFPMINSRAHNVGDFEQWTLNQNFRQTYDMFLRTLAG